MYSQYHEDDYVASAFQGKPAGTLLDVGAWHAIDKSNSRALIEAGWSAVLLEPSPGPMRDLVAFYGNEPRVKLMSAALANDSGYAEMHITDDAVSTSDPATHATWEMTGGYVGRLLVPTVTWSNLFNWFGGFDFISIDAEGMSVPLFVSLMQTEARPHCLVVEHDGRIVEIMQAGQGWYNMTHSNGTNVVLVRK